MGETGELNMRTLTAAVLINAALLRVWEDKRGFLW